MKIEIRPFKPKHLDCIVPREYELQVRQMVGQEWRAPFHRARGFTLIESGVPRAAGGIFPMWAGVGEVWLYLSPWFNEHPKTCFKWAKELLQVLIHEGGYYRVQCPIRQDMPKNKRFVRHLGFKAEGVMARWGPDGHDYVLFSRVAEEGESLCHQRH